MDAGSFYDPSIRQQSSRCLHLPRRTVARYGWSADPSHGGALLRHGDFWYWYGEDKTAHVNSKVTTVTGVSCYRSTDLLNWENLGLCLSADLDPASPLHASKIVERPKVLFHALTAKFVMWMHLDASGYTFSRAGIAVADRPEGAFRLVRVQRSFAYDYGYPADDPRDQRTHGNAFLEMNLFLEDATRSLTARPGARFRVHTMDDLDGQDFPANNTVPVPARSLAVLVEK